MNDKEISDPVKNAIEECDKIKKEWTTKKIGMQELTERLTEEVDKLEPGTEERRRFYYCIQGTYKQDHCVESAENDLMATASAVFVIIGLTLNVIKEIPWDDWKMVVYGAALLSFLVYVVLIICPRVKKLLSGREKEKFFYQQLIMILEDEKS